MCFFPNSVLTSAHFGAISCVRFHPVILYISNSHNLHGHWLGVLYAWMTLYPLELHWGMDGSREVGRRGGREPGNHKSVYVSLEILVRTPFQKQLEPLGSNCFSKEVPTALCDIHRCLKQQQQQQQQQQGPLSGPQWQNFLDPRMCRDIVVLIVVRIVVSPGIAI